MENHEFDYETILLAEAMSDLMSQSLPTVIAAFRALDQLAADADGRDDLLMQVVNTLADILRGTLVALQGVDIRPFSNLGAQDPVDLAHALKVLTKLLQQHLPESATSMEAGKTRDSALRQLCAQVTSVEQILNEYHDRVADQLPEDSKNVLDDLRARVGRIRANQVLRDSEPDSLNGSNSTTA